MPSTSRIGIALGTSAIGGQHGAAERDDHHAVRSPGRDSKRNPLISDHAPDQVGQQDKEPRDLRLRIGQRMRKLLLCDAANFIDQPEFLLCRLPFASPEHQAKVLLTPPLCDSSIGRFTSHTSVWAGWPRRVFGIDAIERIVKGGHFDLHGRQCGADHRLAEHIELQRIQISR